MNVDQAFTGLPSDPAALATVVQGLLMHEHIASTYGLSLSAAKHARRMSGRSKRSCARSWRTIRAR